MPDTPRLPMAPAPWWPLVGGSRVRTCRAPRRLLVPSARGQPPPGLVSIPLAPWHRASTWPAPPHQTQRPPGPLWTTAPPEGLLQLTWPARQDYKDYATVTYAKKQDSGSLLQSLPRSGPHGSLSPLSCIRQVLTASSTYRAPGARP